MACRAYDRVSGIFLNAKWNSLTEGSLSYSDLYIIIFNHKCEQFSGNYCRSEYMCLESPCGINNTNKFYVHGTVHLVILVL